MKIILRKNKFYFLLSCDSDRLIAIIEIIEGYRSYYYSPLYSIIYIIIVQRVIRLRMSCLILNLTVVRFNTPSRSN